MDVRLKNRRPDGSARPPGGRTVCPAEEEALQRLSLLDLSGARAAADVLVREAMARTPRCPDASYLLYDFLSCVDRVVARHQDLPQRGVEERLRTARLLAAARSDEELSRAFWDAYDEATSPLSGMSPPGHPAVEQVKSFIRANYRRKIALADIALAVGVSRNYLSHLFKRHCGVTVTEYIHRTRMKEAEHLLLNGGHSVSEIAYSVGYQNYRDFHRNFVKYEKTSPKKFRQFRSKNRGAPNAHP